MIEKINTFVFIVRCKNCGNLDDKTRIYNSLNHLSCLFNSRVVKRAYKCFKPYGINICYFLSTSHIIYSSYPEYDLVLIEISTCAKIPNLNTIKAFLKTEFNPKDITIKKIEIKLK